MMNHNRFTYKLLQYYAANQTANQGFVLPMIIGLGLIMTVVGLTMIGRSSDQEIRAEQQLQTAQAEQAAEAGIARTLNALNQVGNHQYLASVYPVENEAEREGNPWYEGIGDDDSINACQGVTDTEVLDDLTDEDQNGRQLDDRIRYNLVSYEPQTDEDGELEGGELVMEGFIEDPNDDGQQIATSQISVTFDVGQNRDLFPSNANQDGPFDPQEGDFDGSNLTFTCNEDGCGFPSDLGNVCGGDGFLDNDAKREHFNLQHSSIEDGDLNDVIAYPANMDDFAPVDDVPNTDDISESIDLGDIDSGKELPRDEDRDEERYDNDDIYHYNIGDISLSGQGAQGGDLEINPEEGERVYLYVDGEIDISGNPELVVADNVDLGDFRIYGTGDNQDFTLSGTPGGGAFIFAPEATVDFNGTPTIEGVLWVNALDGSGNQTIQTPDDDQIENLINRLDDDENFDFNRDAFEINEISSPPTSFQRLPANDD